MSTKQIQANDWQLLGDERRDHYRLGESAVDMTRPSPALRAVEIPAQPQNIIVDLGKCALIVVDMQNDFCSRGGWFDSLGVDVSPVRNIYEPIRRTAEVLRGRSVPIIWLNWGVRADRANLSPVTRYAFSRVGCGVGLGDPVKGQQPRTIDAKPTGVLQQGAWGADVVDELAPACGDIRVDKHRISGFWDTPLDSVLRNLGVKTVFFAGINADHCVLATLMDANFHGYDTILIDDCTATGSPEFCLQATLHNVRFCFGFTVTSCDVAARVAQSP
jgi:nicotinamidase-related amidase